MKLNPDKYNAFFFDFDGVIVDSLDIKAQAFGELFKDYGKDVVENVVGYHLNNGGISRYEKFKYYYKSLLNKEINQKIMDDLDKRYSQIVVEKVVKASFIKGAMGFIKRLNELQKECFIISATPQEEINNIAKLKQINIFFKDIVGSPKKKQENLEYLLDKYLIKGNEAVYFGDAKSDYEAAVEHNIHFVGVASIKNKELEGLTNIPKIRNFNCLELI